jgi:hypothetical protein
MTFVKGDPRINKAGRPAGLQNKSTTAIKEAYQSLLEGNLENMNMWLSELAEQDRGRALDYMLKLSEYILPKLSRQEVTGADGEDLFKNIKFEFGTLPEKDDNS